MHTETTIFLNEISKNDKTYLNITKIETKLDASEVSHLEIDGLFGGGSGNKGIVDKTAAKLIVDNKEMFLKEFIPALERAFEDVIETMVYRHIFKVPLDKLFPMK